MKFDEKLFLDDLEKSIDKLNFIDEHLINIKEIKNKYINNQEWEKAAETRDIERFIEKIDLESVMNMDRYQKLSEILNETNR